MEGVRPLWSAPLFFSASGQLGPKIQFTLLAILFRLIVDIVSCKTYNELINKL